MMNILNSSVCRSTEKGSKRIKCQSGLKAFPFCRTAARTTCSIERNGLSGPWVNLKQSEREKPPRIRNFEKHATIVKRSQNLNPCWHPFASCFVIDVHFTVCSASGSLRHSRLPRSNSRPSRCKANNRSSRSWPKACFHYFVLIWWRVMAIHEDCG